ncbi:hypothetical protein XENTR_v10016493 [Xenopus tropicalis]|uniref:Uncharacterized protein LOC100145148 isoform X9 n=2 Tax=Xenopus tropicalis TaxID=8364 RepID=A0A8J0SMH7_XENTR|nr:uncharacterized protein LOC100145148 isoform X9 [Xenopus tropicalis]KAE8597521.1 hypothetical protein XENTR_v10016493 [Xenopus tropicalis]|eukprot:XP_012819739.1 PREDICTED: uncharacterized protein LOC100145148 isoform X10 [Xenopus tropicalis]
MMEVFSSDKSSLDKYINLEDYVLCRKRKEPLIGLQYIVQMNSDVRSETAFQCNLCLKKGPLYCIMQHLKSFKHRLNYIRQKYDHILPLYGKNTPFYEQELILREQAKEIEQSEGSNKMKISINLTATGVYKDDFWKYNLIRHQKMSALKEKILHLADQQEAVLKYLDSFTIRSQEEANIVQDLTNKLEAAVQVFNQYTKQSRTETSDSYKKNKKHEYKDKEYPENKEFKSETRKAIQDKQYLAHCSSVSVSEEFKESSFDTREAPEADDENKNSVKTSEQIQSRPAWVCRTKSTGYRNTKWESLFANDASSQKPLTPFKWGSKLTSSFDSTNINPADEQSKRRASTELLSSFTLFNRGNSTDQTHNSDPSWTRLSSPPSEDNSSNSHKGKDNCKEKDLEDNEDYCAADSSCSVTCDMDAYVTPVKDQIYVSVTHSNLSNPLGDIDMTKKPNQITAGQSADFQLERDEKTETEQDLCKKSCAQYLDIEDATTSTPQANIAHTESTPLTPELLQLLKGKDVNLITETLKTISPFYPALQKVNLEELAKVISETGALE